RPGDLAREEGEGADVGPTHDARAVGDGPAEAIFVRHEAEAAEDGVAGGHLERDGLPAGERDGVGERTEGDAEQARRVERGRPPVVGVVLPAEGSDAVVGAEDAGGRLRCVVLERVLRLERVAAPEREGGEEEGGGEGGAYHRRQ